MMVERDMQALATEILRAQKATNEELKAVRERLTEVDEAGVKADAYAADRRSFARRNIAVLLVALLALAGVLNAYVDKRHEDAATRERRVTGRGVLYRQCEEQNDLKARLDRSLQDAFAQGIQAGREGESVSRGLDNFRQGLSPSDCESTLGDLTGQDRERAKQSAAAVPRLPLPPVTIPGYVPTTTPAAR